MKKKILILFITFGIILRFVGLDYSPPHLSNDEISIAYDAYSLLHTLKDQHNNFLPISFESFGTYKAPLAIYLSLPTTVLFGNNEYSVRLPSAIFGSLTVIFLGLLVFELTKKNNLSLFSSLLLSSAPWHIYSSRMALESNIALFFVILGLYCFFYGINRNNTKFVLFSFISFALSIYGYHTEWGFTPMIITSLFFFNRKVIFKKAFFIGLILFLLLISPIFIDAIHNLGTNARANTEIIFNDPSVSSELHNESLNIFQKGGVVLEKFISNYSSYMSLNTLFFNGLHLLPIEDPFQVGLFLTPLLPFFFIGFVKVKHFFKNQYKFIYSWLIISPIIPSLTIGEVNQVRYMVAVAPFIIFIATGLVYFLDNLRDKIWRFFVYGIYLISFLFFLTIYFYHFPYEGGQNFQYGYKQIAQYINKVYQEYQTIIVDPRFGEGGIYSGVPHLYIPYYTYLNPDQLQNSKIIPNGIAFGKYEFRNIDWNAEQLSSDDLYVVSYSNSPPMRLMNNLKNVYEVRLPNRKEAFIIYQVFE